MDLPYSQQQQARRKNLSAGTLRRMSLAPMTTRLPVDDDLTSSPTGGDYGYGHSQSHDQLYTYFSPVTTSTPSYLQGKSAPTTPRLLSKSPPASTPSRSHSHEGRHFLTGAAVGAGGSGLRSAAGAVRPGLRGASGLLPKSHSTTHLPHHTGQGRRHSSGGRRHKKPSADDHLHHRHHHHHGLSEATDRASSNDWLLRTGALMTSETRETKGQSWLTARASSTSLTGLRDTTEEESAAAFERELARERGEIVGVAAGAGGAGSHHVSRMGSRMGSRTGSRVASRAHSRIGSRVQLLTPLDQQSLEMSGPGTGPGTATSLSSVGASGYFDAVDMSSVAGVEEDNDWGGGPSAGGPDFVNLDAKLEAIEYEQDTSLADEDHVRRLVKREKAAGSWIGSVFGWSLFSVQEGESDDDDDDDSLDEDEEEESETDDESEDGEDGEDGEDDEDGEDGGKGKGRRHRKASQSLRTRQFVPNFEERVPPPPKANEGTWQDAAWLLSVASKVIL